MKLGFLVDLNLCMGCKGCEVACKVENEVPLSTWRLRVKYIDIGTFPDTSRSFTPLRCNHCESAPCERICPVSALHYLENTERECARVLINDRQVWVPGTLIGDHFGWNLCFTLPSGQRIPAASFSLKLKVYPPKGSGEQPWFSPVFDRKTLHYFKQLKAGTSADFLYVSARKKAEARIPAVRLK